MRKLLSPTSITPGTPAFIQEIREQPHGGLGSDIDRFHQRDDVRRQELWMRGGQSRGLCKLGENEPLRRGDAIPSTRGG